MNSTDNLKEKQKITGNQIILIGFFAVSIFVITVYIMDSVVNPPLVKEHTIILTKKCKMELTTRTSDNLILLVGMDCIPNVTNADVENALKIMKQKIEDMGFKINLGVTTEPLKERFNEFEGKFET